jgi:hypothetical protein
MTFFGSFEGSFGTFLGDKSAKTGRQGMKTGRKFSLIFINEKKQQAYFSLYLGSYQAN